MIMRRVLAAVTLCCVLLASFASPAVFAEGGGQPVDKKCSDTWNVFGINPWYACLPSDGHGGVKITQLNDIYLIILPAIDSIVKVAAYISTGMIFYMIIRMMYARGDTGKIATATNGMRDAVVGLIICLISTAIVTYIAKTFGAQ